MRLPSALTIVAVLFLLFGAMATGISIVHVWRGTGGVDFSALNLLVGVGLLRRDAYYRRWALVWCWLTLGLAAFVFANLAGGWAKMGPIQASVFGATVTTMPRASALFATALVLVITLWQLRVLHRHDVRTLFVHRTAGRARRAAP